jgi:hypothetical protein
MSIHDLEIWAHGTAEQLDVFAVALRAAGNEREHSKRIPLKGEAGRYAVHVRVQVTTTAPPAGTAVRKPRARKATQ